MWAKWMVQALHGKGNVIYLGGPAGNPVGAAQLADIVKVFAKHPGMKLLTGNKNCAGHQLGSGDGAEGDRGAACQVPEDRRHHRQLRHRRAGGDPGVPGGRPQARPGRGARRERALLPVPVDASRRRSPDRDDLDAQLARPDRGPQGDRRGRGAPEQRAQPHHSCRSSRTRCQRQGVPCNPKARPGLLPVRQASRPPGSRSTGRSASARDRSPRRSPPHGRRQDVPGRRRPQRRDLRGARG